MFRSNAQRILALSGAFAAIAGCSKQTALQAPTPHQATGLPTGAFSALLRAPADAQLPAYHTEALAMFPHLLGAAFPDAANVGDNISLATAYDSQDDTYLTVYVDFSKLQFMGRIKDAHGTPQVADFAIAPFASVAGDAAKAIYLPQLNQFAVVYPSKTGPNNADILLQRINAAGALIGAPVPVSTATGNQVSPDLAFDPIHQRLEVVWQDNRSNANAADIYGRLLAFDGNQTIFLTNETLIGNSAPDPNHGYQEANQEYPTIAFGSAQQRYVVTWTDNRNDLDADTPSSNGNGYDIYGSVLNANGSPIGGNFPVSTLAEDQFVSSIAYLPVSDKFLVAFTSSNDVAISGVCTQGSGCTFKFGADAGVLGAGLDGDGSVLGSGVISNQYGRQFFPSVAANNTSMTWLVAFNEDITMPPDSPPTTPTHINGRHVGWAFQLGDVFAITPNNVPYNVGFPGPAISANTDDQEFLVDYTQVGAHFSLWGQRVDRGY